MTPTSKVHPCRSLPAAPRPLRGILLALLAIVPLGSGCQAPQGDATTEPVRPAVKREPLSPVQESALKLLAAIATKSFDTTQFPAGFTVASVQQEPIAEQSRKFGAVGKITLDFKSPDAATSKVVYTVYPSVADAESRFAAIGEPPANRNGVKSTSPLAIAGLDVPTWGEVSSEAYGGKPLVRASAAARVGRVITVTQTITMTEMPDPQALSRTIDLLKQAVIHAQAVEDTAPAPAPSPAVSSSPAEPAPIATAPPTTPTP